MGIGDEGEVGWVGVDMTTDWEKAHTRARVGVSGWVGVGY